MVKEIKIDEAFQLNLPIIDVRSPSEFANGHIPMAVNIPLFLDDERAAVGIAYKQQSKEAAIELGYNFVTPKLDDFITESFKVAADGRVIVHCWRGGMRSKAFAKHLFENKFNEVNVIIGGYKAYRNYVLDDFSKQFNLKILGGFTGSGKTHILYKLKKLGQQIIDLEGLANHKGSAFGGIGLADQPTVEQFENNFHKELKKLDLKKTIWVEDESHGIGKVKIPMPFYKQMRNAMLYFLDMPKEARAKHLVKEYAKCDIKLLEESILRIAKRLGGLEVKNSIELLEKKNFFEVALITLGYYDKSYSKGMSKRESTNIITISLPSTNHYENALIIEKHI